MTNHQTNTAQNPTQVYTKAPSAVPLETNKPLNNITEKNTPSSPSLQGAPEERQKGKRRIGNLDTLADLYREMTLLYRDAYHGRIPADMYTKCAYVLDCAGRALQARNRDDADYKAMLRAEVRHFIKTNPPKES